MCLPRAQLYGSLELEDDLGIDSADRLLRHCRTPVQIVPDERLGMRVSSQAFVAKANETCSIDLECLMIAAGVETLSRCGVMPNTYAMVAVKAKAVRDLGGGVAHTPKPEDSTPANDFHGDIVSMTRGMSRKLIDAAEILALQAHPFSPPEVAIMS